MVSRLAQDFDPGEGLPMPGENRCVTQTLQFINLETREVPAALSVVEAFNQATTQVLPVGWAQWGSDAQSHFALDDGAGLGDTGRLVSTSNNLTTSRAWVVSAFPADVETSASVYLNSAIPARLFARGSNMTTTKTTYYGVQVTRGLEVQLTKVQSGTTFVLGTVKSKDVFQDKWVTVTLRAEGTTLKAYVFRGDTSQYLAADGTWTRQPTAAIEKTDSAIRSGGLVGFDRPLLTAGTLIVDSFRAGPIAIAPNSLSEDRFSTAASSNLPAGWNQWSNGGVTYGTKTDETFRIDGASTSAARAWMNKTLPADGQFSSSIFVDSLIPAGVLARGQNLNTTSANYYGVTVTRGLDVKLVRSVNGVESTLANIKSESWLSGLWVQASIILKGDEIRVQIFRSDTGQYLNANGSWGLSPAYAITRADVGVRGGGSAGLLRGKGYAGQLVFDNFIASAAPASLIPANIPTGADKPTVIPTPPPDLPPVGTPKPTPSPTPTTPVPTTPVNAALPAVPRNYSWIRLANLAYYGTPINNAFEQSLLRNSIDLVVTNVAYLDEVAKASPETPQMIYTNVSNIYLDMISDWLNYAEKNNLNREGAFYHVTKATAFNGLSASSLPVDRFWAAYKQEGTTVTDLTRAVRPNDASFTLPASNGTLSLGSFDRFREINLSLSASGTSGYRGVWEYVSAVDSTGKPTAWRTLTTIADGTANGTRSGKVTFDPPKDWKTASINASDKLYYVRFRATGTGSAPTANSILGRDFTNFRNQTGTIPAFDTTADRDGDGYLNDVEYARRKTGMDARFVHESRLFYPNYGPNRFATNISDVGFRRWAADFHVRYLRDYPLAQGLFVDNSIGRLAVDPTGIKESISSYTEDYGSLLGVIDTAVGSKWLLANTAGAGKSAEPIARAGVSTLEEFALRPTTANHVQFEDLAALLAYRRQLSNGKAYEILDSLPIGLDASNNRVETTTLAMYYLLADPNLSMLMLNGGNEPNTTWQRHWTDAATYNVGKPTTNFRMVANGNDPANSSLEYKVYRRDYQNAIVLYKPLSYTRGTTGTIADNTATTHDLGGSYRVVQADGSLGPAITRISLRNGEGVVLAKSR